MYIYKNTTKAPRLTPTPQAYMIPENFHEEHLQLIQSIKIRATRSASVRSEASGEFRHSGCQDLLMDHFQKMFNKLPVWRFCQTQPSSRGCDPRRDFRGYKRPPGAEAKKRSRQASRCLCVVTSAATRHCTLCS